MLGRHDERGEGRLGFLVSLAVCGILVFLGFKLIPVRIDAYEFRDVLRQEARMGAVRNSDDLVAQRIMDQAQELRVPLERQNLKVQRTRTKMVITASYEQPVDLKLTTYVYRFHAREEAPLF